MPYLRAVDIGICIMLAASFYSSNDKLHSSVSGSSSNTFIKQCKSSEWIRAVKKNLPSNYFVLALMLHISGMVRHVADRVVYTGMCAPLKLYGCRRSAQRSIQAGCRDFGLLNISSSGLWSLLSSNPLL